MDIPQSISSVTKELLRDQEAYRLNEAVRNVAGVNQFSVYDDFTMRGFRNADYRLINGMRMAANFWSSPLLVNVERVEFIKGPASALFGNANPGGTINMVTKKPLDETSRAVDFSVGSFNTVRTAADFTGPFNENKTCCTASTSATRTPARSAIRSSSAPRPSPLPALFCQRPAPESTST